MIIEGEHSCYNCDKYINWFYIIFENGKAEKIPNGQKAKSLTLINKSTFRVVYTCPHCGMDNELTYEID